jgi:hypothetical protein
MTGDVNEHLISMFRHSKRFAVQLDHSSDVADCSLLRIYVHFINAACALTEKTVGNLKRRVIFPALERFVT